MSEPAPPGVAADAAGRPAQALSPAEIDRVLDDFRDWLARHATVPPPTDSIGPAGDAPDMHSLLGQMVALRQEVNLQTRATRNQQEQNAQTLQRLSEALEALREARTPEPTRQEDCIRPLLNTLLDVHEAVARAGREIKRGEDTLGPLLQQVAEVLRTAAEPDSPPAGTRPQTWWARLFQGGQPPEQAHANERARHQARTARGGLERVHQALASLMTGYGMSLQRLERALAQHGLEPIPSEGRPFDPELMEVLEAATGTGRSPGDVVEEVRRGYLYRGRVFRYAQVRVARD